MSGPNFSMGYQNLLQVDSTPDGASRTWLSLREGIASKTPGNNDSIDQTPYLSGNGYGNTRVQGQQLTIPVSGHRVIGDAAQDYIVSLSDGGPGNGRTTNGRWITKDGKIKSGSVTIANVVEGDGDAGSKDVFSCEMHFNGKPTLTMPQPAATLTIVVAGGVASGSTKVTATPDAGNSLKYLIGSAGIGVGNVSDLSYVDGLIDYTSGADIPGVVAGQFLLVYEVTADSRVAKYNEHELLAGDITA